MNKLNQVQTEELDKIFDVKGAIDDITKNGNGERIDLSSYQYYYLEAHKVIKAIGNKHSFQINKNIKNNNDPIHKIAEKNGQWFPSTDDVLVIKRIQEGGVMGINQMEVSVTVCLLENKDSEYDRSSEFELQESSLVALINSNTINGLQA